MFSFTWDSGEIRKNVHELPPRIDRAIRAAAAYQAHRGEAYMKVNAPWTDRTGAARTGLHTLTSFTPQQYMIIFAHTVHYGIWLEIANSGDYQIIMPAVRAIGRDLMAQLDGLFGRIR